MKFLNIGFAYKKTSKKTGREYISLSILKEKLCNVDTSDYSKFCLFVNTWKHGHEDRPDYTLCVPVKEETAKPEQLRTACEVVAATDPTPLDQEIQKQEIAERPYFNAASEILPWETCASLSIYDLETVRQRSTYDF